MKKKRGFTLIELLAVIVILAIIALIATPIVMNVIENARKGAAERSAENYVRAVETAITTERLDSPVEDGEYAVDSDGNLVLGETTIKVEVSGDKPAAGSKVKITNSLVDKENTSLTISGYSLTYNAETKTFEASESSGEEPTADNLFGVWIFDETLSLPDYSPLLDEMSPYWTEEFIIFTSNNITFNRIATIPGDSQSFFPEATD